MSAPGPATGVLSTGEPRIDAALAPLRRLPGLPVAEHADVYDEVHRGLQDALADPDEG